MDIVLPPGSAPAGAKDGKADNPKGTKGRALRGKNGMRFSKARQPSTTTSTGESAWHGRGGVLRGRVGARACVCVGVVVLGGGHKVSGQAVGHGLCLWLWLWLWLCLCCACAHQQAAQPR